jgi:hypothetical protein
VEALKAEAAEAVDMASETKAAWAAARAAEGVAIAGRQAAVRQAEVRVLAGYLLEKQLMPGGNEGDRWDGVWRGSSDVRAREEMRPEAERLVWLARSAGYSEKVNPQGSRRSYDDGTRQFVQNVFVYAQLAQRKLTAPNGGSSARPRTAQVKSTGLAQNLGEL